MTPTQQRFREFLELNTPDMRLLELWNWDERELDLPGLDRYLGYASSGEKLFAKFAAGLWLGDNRYAFDLFDAAPTLSLRQRQAIAMWFTDPFYP